LSQREKEAISYMKATLNPKDSDFHEFLHKFWDHKTATIPHQGAGGVRGGIPLRFPSRRVIRVTGPAASGKSTWIRSRATQDDLILVPSAELKEHYNDLAYEEGGPIAETPELFLANNDSYAARIFIDEWSLLHPGLIEIAARFSLSGEVYIVGDHEQVLWNPSGYKGEEKWKGGPWHLDINAELLLTKNYRSNSVLVAFSNCLHVTQSLSVRPLPKTFPLTFTFLEGDEADYENHGQNIVFLQVDRSRKQGKTPQMVQGKEWPVCTIDMTRRAFAQPEATTKGHLYVAATRARDELHIVAKGKARVESYIRAYNRAVEFWNGATGDNLKSITMPPRRQIQKRPTPKPIPLNHERKLDHQGHWKCNGKIRHRSGRIVEKGETCEGQCHK
jgi:hypothetical protein